MRPLILISLMITVLAHADGWKVDFSRRFKETPPPEITLSPMPADMSPAEREPASEKSVLEKMFSGDAVEQVTQEIVILQTEKGFVPSRVQVRQGQAYKIDVVNVNDKEKNVSFVLDAFSEHHATYYGKIKSFVIHPQQDGIYPFQSPETAFQGQIVVMPTDRRLPKEFKLDSHPPVPGEPPQVRAPASEE